MKTSSTTMDFTNLPSNHFLAQPRPDPLLSQLAGLVDTTTLAAHDFDVDNRTGFMPPQPPLERLPPTWEIWESTLDAAVSQRLQLAERVEEMELQRRATETSKSRHWRHGVTKVCHGCVFSCINNPSNISRLRCQSFQLRSSSAQNGRFGGRITFCLGSFIFTFKPSLRQSPL